VREAEELEDFRPSLPAFATPLLGKRPEEKVPRLVGVQLESESLEALAQVGTKPSRVTLVPKAEHEIIRNSSRCPVLT
jgi:hypothetical protein